MPTQYRPPWGYGFAPLFRGPYSDQHLRVSDAERQAVADRLAEHYGDGRLDQAEFDERVGRAMSAKTRADLSSLFDDLPETGASAGPEGPRRGRARSAAVLVLAVVITVVAVHTVSMVAPWLWLGFLGVILLFATGTIGRSRPGQDR